MIGMLYILESSKFKLDATDTIPGKDMLNGKEWNRMLSIHLDGAFSVTKSCWPYFIKQKYGRVVMTSSPAGLYGTDGSVHYAVSKMGVVGFASSLQIEAR
jgi:NAD(P)-dependent dehydrogenase (short-subunit alcohol dehydrogenase family)